LRSVIVGHHDVESPLSQFLDRFEAVADRLGLISTLFEQEYKQLPNLFIFIDDQDRPTVARDKGTGQCHDPKPQVLQSATAATARMAQANSRSPIFLMTCIVLSSLAST
jgi:hypothetical protein